MNDREWKERLDKIDKAIADIPGSELREKLRAQAAKVAKDRKESRAAMDSFRTSLDDLRTKLKYVVFDLEATKRENIDLRQQVQEYQDEEDGRED